MSFCIGPFVAVLIQNSISTEMNKWAYRSLFVAQWGFGVSSIIIAPFMPESVFHRVSVYLDYSYANSLKISMVADW